MGSRKHTRGGSSKFLRRFALPAVLAVAGAVLASCGSDGGSGTITLYNGQHPQLTEALASAFEKQTGIQVRVRTDDGIVLADQILQEGSGSPADVYLTENSPELMMLTQHGLLAKLPASILDQIPSRYNSPTANWVGVALRVNALAYDPSLVAPSHLPASIVDLAQPQWRGKVAIAPTDSDFVPLVGAVIATYGQQGALRWLKGLKANAVLYQNDEAVVAAVDRGQATVGIVNQYYWYRLRLEQGAAKTTCQALLLPSSRRRRHREHLRRRGAYLITQQGGRPEVRGVPRVSEGPTHPGLGRRLRVSSPSGDPPESDPASPVPGRPGGHQCGQPGQRSAGRLIAPAGRPDVTPVGVVAVAVFDTKLHQRLVGHFSI